MEITEAIRSVRSRLEQLPSAGCSQILTVKANNFKKDILEVYTPSLQGTLCTDPQKCFFGNYPTLATLNKTYGSRAGATWVVPQITDCVAFTNNKGTLDDMQTESLASLIASEYYYLKVSELMLFFRRFKLGKYKEIYGNFSPMAITLSIREFLIERNDAYFKHETEIEEEKISKERGSSISYQEYLKWKKENNKHKQL